MVAQGGIRCQFLRRSFRFDGFAGVCLLILAAPVSTEIDQNRMDRIDILVWRRPGAVISIWYAGRGSTAST
jgi:hypothetical protein